jgi:hypothetical protein
MTPTRSASQHFFNNVQKDQVVKVKGLHACRQLLAYLLREVGIQRQRLLDGQAVDDTMLTRLVQFQLGRSTVSAARPPDLDPRLVSVYGSPKTSWGPSSARLRARKRQRAG